MNPVLFLDFDGPLFPDRVIRHGPHISSYPGSTSFHPHVSYWEMDVTSVRQLNSLYKIFPFDTVVSSSWKNFTTVDQVVDLFSVNGLNLHLHQDWCTPYNFTNHRSHEIAGWLYGYTQNNICPDHIILDDPWSGATLDGGVHKLLKFNEPLFINPDVGIDSDVYNIMLKKVTKWANDVDSHKFYRGVDSLVEF